MHYFPGVRWDEWEDLPYHVVLGCLDFIDAKLGGGGDGEGAGS